MLDIQIAIDSTGSMYTCIAQIKKQAELVVNKLFREIDGLRISFAGFGNYRDSPNIVESIPFLGIEDISEVVEFIKSLGASVGGGHRLRYRGSTCPACSELVMRDATQLDWRPDVKKVLVLVGDENPSHPEEGQAVDWKQELKKLVNLNVNVYGVHCLDVDNSRQFYRDVAMASEGVMLPMSQFADIVDIMTAISLKQKSPEALSLYEYEVQFQNRMSRNLAEAFNALSGRVTLDKVDFDYGPDSADQDRLWAQHDPFAYKPPIIAKKTTYSKYSGPTGLVPVEPSRFQILDVDKKCDIKEFVQDNGVTFKKGKGFYEVTKVTEIQPYKEIVLVEKSTGDMWTGTEARSILKLADDKITNLHPRDVPPQYKAFAQSTSVNRALLPNTKFLYELDHV